MNATSLSPGMCVGPWRIVDVRGSGAYGTVYLAAGVEPEVTGDVALKLAVRPRDARFGREAALLSRVRHPCVPRLFDHGQWESAAGLSHPYVVMEWVQGISLYEWARAVAPTSRQVLGLFAGLARALEAIHAEDAVHRDVKGDNVLVRLEDGRGFLVDFGSSHYPGADKLTDGVFPPGTPHYRSPEAYGFAANILRSPVKTYAPGPEEDLFALGVTGYRLVTGRYPPLPQDPKDAETDVWEPGGPGPRPARELNPCCGLELSALISRMLSVRPEDRGSARELAEALEQAAREAGPEADAPLYKTPRAVDAEAAPRHTFQKAAVPMEAEAAPGHDILPPVPPPVEAGAASLRIEPPETRGNWLPRLVAGLSWTAALSVAWGLSTTSVRQEGAAQIPLVAEQEEARDGGTVGLGDSVLTAPVDSKREPSSGSPIAFEMPSKPLPGQVRPDARGRCPYWPLVAINGGCWVKTDGDPKVCASSEHTYVYKGACYQPVLSQLPLPTSSPTEVRDGG